MREVILYGPMRARFGRSFRLDVASPAEAIRALTAVVPGFRAWFARQAQAGAAYHVLVGQRDLAERELADLAPAEAPIRIAPALRGAKRGGLFQVILGAAMIAFAFSTGGASLLATLGTNTASTVVGLGASMVLSGVAQLLAPQVKAGTPAERPDNQPSYVFDGPVNTTSQGQPVPVLYGELLVGSAVISAGITTEEIAANA
ncbi:tail assembly protein [Chitiniphilus shinanonensis]|uniref:tail assembly protein n=1 Tax=Chitiniphilus shinanonensis TaxID=553088 RepID=UPI00303D1D8E